jgi:hypothetical protein
MSLVNPGSAAKSWRLSWKLLNQKLGIIPGGETLTDLRTRAAQTINVLVGHTVINRIILLGILGLGNECFWHIKQDTCH